MSLSMLVMACSSVSYHNGRNSISLAQPDQVDLYPLQADVKVEQQISGVAECESWFGFLTKKPQRQTFGATLQEASGDFSPSPCTRGAIYDALAKNNAEMILSPRYTAVQKKNWCLLGLCLHKVNQIIVTGYKASVKNIRPMDEEIVKIKRKSAYSTDKQSIVSIK